MHQGSAQSFPATDSTIVYPVRGERAVGQTQPAPTSLRSSPTEPSQTHHNRGHYNNIN